MTEFIITSSVLILIVIALRHFLKGKISLRLQYALWALVLVRLMVPSAFLESPISVMNAVQRSAAYRTAEQTLIGTQVYSDIIRNSEMTTEEARGAGNGTLHEIQGHSVQSGYGDLRTFIFMDSLGSVLKKVLRIVWLAGIAVIGLCLLLSNLSFGRKLRKTRKEFRAAPCKLPVYSVETLPSPFLFGLFRPAIYITPEVAADETKLRHVLAHELTHYRHGDHIWSTLRGLCLAVHWYNPLVWLAATLSRRDAELACDEAAIKSIGEANRLEYGRTLIGLTCEKRRAVDLLCCATTMTDGKNGIRERILLIAKKPKMLIPALIAVVLVTAAAVGCTFTAAENEESDTIPLTAEEVEQYNKTFLPLLFDEQGNPSLNLLSHFLTSYFDRPEDINLAEFLRYFPPEGDVTDEAEFKALKAEKNWPFGADATLDSMPVPIHKFPAGSVSEALKEHMGITLDDLSGVGMDALIYLKEYDAFYNFTSDFAADAFVCVRGETQGDTVRLFGETATLTLKKQGDGFLIVSHQRAGNAVGESGGEAFTESSGEASALFVKAEAEGKALEGAIIGFMGDGWWYAGEQKASDFKAAAFVTLREEATDDSFMFYGVSMYRSYGYSGGGFTVVEDFLVPCVITLDRTTLSCTDFWVPGDGAYFDMDIYEKFPADIAEEAALNSYQYYDRLAENCDGKAEIYGGIDLSDCCLTITSDGKTVAPYENPLWAHTYGENGWIYGDGRSVSYSLREISAGLPSVTLREDLNISYAGGVTRSGGLDVYNENFDQIYQKADMLYLTALPEGTYYIAINVEMQGDYIEAAGDYESFGYECVFCYVVDEYSYDELLMSRPVNNKVCVMLRLTYDHGLPGYIVPDEQEVWMSAFESAVQSAGEGKSWLDSEISLGVYIVWQDEYWQFTDSGALINHSSGRVEPEDAAELYSLLGSITAKYGIGAFRPDMVKNLVSATLEYGESYTVTDADTLSRLQDMLSGATEIRGGTGCPFDALLTLELEDGSALRLAIATDSCGVYMVNGVYFDYSSGDNMEFFSLFGISA